MTVQEWLGADNKLGQDIWHNKYQQNSETFEEWLDRVSGGNKDIRQLIAEKKFLFGGRILANRGIDQKGINGSMSNCYVIDPPSDSLESIYECASKIARTFSYGGGCGTDLSNLAPRGAKVSNTAKETSGAVSFMDLYSLTTGLIGQSGRRGALMLSLNCSHPDIEEFIEVKTDLNRVTKANISIRITDDFMRAVENDEDYTLSFTRDATGQTIEKTVKARALFRRFAEVNWDYAEPGVLFWDRIEDYNLLSTTPDFKYAGVNPCFTGDMSLLTADGYKTFSDLCGKEVVVVSPSGEMSAGKVWSSGVKDTVRLDLSDGTYITCTPNHVFMTGDCGECMAMDLNGKQLMPFLDFENMSYDHPKIPRGAPYVRSITPNGKAEVYDFSEPNTHWGVVNGVVAHNCGEEPLPAGGSCLLGSINLSEFVVDGQFDFESFKMATRVAVRALNEVLDEGLPLHPLQEQRESVKKWRQIGLGMFGLADMLIKLKIKYGSDESVALCNKIGQLMFGSAFLQSTYLASENPEKTCALTMGNATTTQFYNNQGEIFKHGNALANSQILTIAPTGTLSTMLGVSGGIEPIYANYYERKTESLHDKDVYYKVYTPIVKEYMDAHGISDDADLPDYFVTAKDLPYEDRIQMQAVWQKHIDASISSTVNLPESATVEDVEKLYMLAWKSGLKGITIFRDKCKRTGILSTPADSTPDGAVDANAPEELPRGFIMPKSDDLVGKLRTLTTGCGSLHVTAFFDPSNAEFVHTFLSKGSRGGCQNFMVGLSRMISLAARGGIGLPDIVDQLNSCGTCSSYAVRAATKHDTSIGACCPMAVGNALMDMWDEMKREVIADEDMEDRPSIVVKPTNAKAKAIQSKATDNTCPTCGSGLIAEGGCSLCKGCGWSKCS